MSSSYERATFFKDEVPYTREEFDAAKALLEGLSHTMQLALTEVLWQEALDIARESALKRSESDGH